MKEEWNEDKLDYYLLNNLGKIKVQNDPFPHAIINKPIPDVAYNRLVNSFPSYKYFKQNYKYFSDEITPKTSNKRYQMMKNDINKFLLPDNPWRIYSEINSSLMFFKDFLLLFKDSIDFYYPGLFNKLINSNKVGIHGKNKFKNNFQVLTQSSADINTRTIINSAVRGPHLDQPNKLYFGLHYMKSPEELEHFGGDLILWQHKNKSKTKYFNNYRIILKDDIAEHSVIPYEKNLFVIGLNTLDSIHSVSVRKKGAPFRKFSNHFAQLPFKLFKRGIK